MFMMRGKRYSMVTGMSPLTSLDRERNLFKLLIFNKLRSEGV